MIYGPVMSLWFGQELTVVATPSPAAEEIFTTQGLNFSSRPKSSFGELAIPGDIMMVPDSAKSKLTTGWYLEVVVANISSRMILKKRFSAVAGKGNEGVELEQVRNYKELSLAIAESLSALILET